MRTYRLLWLLLLPLAALGCARDEEVRSYDVELPLRQKMRLLGAIIPQGDKTWFVKLSGPEAEVAQQKKAFDEFIGSIRFDAKKNPPIEWSAPQGWKEQAGGSLTMAAFRIDAKPQPLEATVTSLGKLGEAGNTVLANVNRWRGQLTLPPLGEADLEKGVRREDVGGQAAYLVDLTGLSVNRKSRPMGPHAGMPPALLPGGAAKESPFRFEVPAGWTELAKPAGMSIVSFEVGQGKERAEVTITGFPGPAGGVVENIVRWRGQVGLPPANKDEILREARKLPSAGAEATYVDLASPPGAARDVRILGAILPQEKTTWFVKMIGPTETVGREKANFEAFVKSLKRDAQ